MSRIAYRAFVLLACTVMCAGLIAVRPLPAVPSPANSQGGTTLLIDEPATSEAAAPAAVRTFTQHTQDASTDTDASAQASVEPTKLSRFATAALAPRLRFPANIPGAGPALAGTLVVQTERLDLYIGKQTFSLDQISGLAPLLEQILRDDEAHFGTTLQHRVSIGFYRAALAPQRGMRGLAYTDEQRAELYYRPFEDPTRAATIAAHELGHHLEAQRYGEGDQRAADTILHEGLATWIAADRWLPMCGATSWKARARQLRNAGVPLRLLTAERSGADNAYELWASFVDFVIERYGWERFDALYRSGRGRAPGSSDYQAVLGKPVDRIADEWRAWLDE